MKSNGKTATGIEIGAAEIRIVSARKTGAGIQVVAATRTAVELGTIQDGCVVDSQKLIQILKVLRKQHKVRSRQVTVSLPAECSVARIVMLSEGDPQHIARFVQDEIRQYASLSGRETVSDFQVITPGRPGAPGRILVVGADRGLAIAVSEACRHAGFVIGAIEPAVAACVRLLDVVQASDPSAVRRLLAIRRKEALTLCIFSGGRLDFVRTKGIGAADVSDRCIRDEINAAIQFYDTEHADKPQPWHVVILDESEQAAPDGLAESMRTGILADHVDVWTDGTLPDGVAADPQVCGAPSATALGSALRSLVAGEHGPQVNLLCADTAETESIRRTILVTANLLAVLVLVTVLIVGGLQLLFQRTARNVASVKLAQLTRGELELAVAMDQLEYVEQRRRLLADELDCLRSISESRQDVNWVQLLTDIQTSTPQMVRIVSLSTDAGSDIVMDGISRSYEAVHTFVAMLNRSARVQRASLLETRRAGAHEGYVRFAVRCSLYSMETP